MELEVNASNATIPPGTDMSREDGMVRQVVWEEIRRRHREEGVRIRQLARQFDLDRNTIRRCLRQGSWKRYARTARVATMLAPHAEFLRSRAPDVDYSARILYQELVGQRGFQGSYDTVKIFVRPLRALRDAAHRGGLVAFHPLFDGKHQVRILPEHGPGAAVRNARQTRSTPLPSAHDSVVLPQVEIRDLAVYETLFATEMEVAS